MKIKQILQQHRRDFTAIYECEHCGHTLKDSGYDDSNFHHYVIPATPCPECKKTASSEYAPMTTKYAEDEVV